MELIREAKAEVTVEEKDIDEVDIVVNFVLNQSRTIIDLTKTHTELYLTVCIRDVIILIKITVCIFTTTTVDTFIYVESTYNNSNSINNNNDN